jgi:UDP-GlcNAc:undecaprenyl-phosphate/decaprenyl-phosphate GlcNAc-1-phosphate transferase
VREYLLTLMVAAVVTYVTTPLVRAVAIAAGACAPVRERDVHDVPTPRLGGVAMFAGMASALLVASNLPLLQSVFRNSSDARALISGGAVICLLGVIDDRWGLDAVTKLAGQVLAAGVMVLDGVQLIWLPLGSGVFTLDGQTGPILTVLVVVITINAVNFVDGLDGLAAGVVAIAALASFSYSYVLSVQQGFDRATPPTLITAVLAGICLGFLPHNFHPARIFMGDSGSMLIGLLLASSSITLTSRLDPNALVSVGLVPALIPVLLPFAVIALPLADLLTAVIRRTRAGQVPWAPDKKHLHHRLLEIGHSHRRAVLIAYIWSALIGGTFAVLAFSRLGAVVVWLAAAAVAAVAVVLSVPRWHRSRR